MKIINFIHHCIFILVLLLTVTVIWPGLDGPLVFDDYNNLSQLINDSQVDYKKFIFENKSGPLGRSVSMISFAFNYWLDDELVIFNFNSNAITCNILSGDKLGLAI